MSRGSVRETSEVMLIRNTSTGKMLGRGPGILPGARPRRVLIPLVALALSLSSGCQKGPAGNSAESKTLSSNHPPVVHAVTIQPVPFILTGPIVAHVEAQDVDRNPLRFRYQWSINGEVVPGQDGEQLSAALLKRGDRVSVQAWPHDGIVEGESMTSQPAVVGNSPPVGAIEVRPAYVFPGTPVQIQANISDPDGDSVHVVYRWWKNDKLIHDGDEAEFDTSGFVRGDTLRVEAVPSDGTVMGATIRSSTITVGNAPPQILSTPSAIFANNRYSYQIEAKDLEDDVITFSLEAAPPGMQIDAQTGLVTWVAQPSQVGIHKVRVLAKDSQGASGFQEFELKLTTVTAPAPAGA